MKDYLNKYMPQLDRYLVFSEIFWFIILFSLSYLVIYYFLLYLVKGMRLRNALFFQMHLLNLFIKREKTNLELVSNNILQSRLLIRKNFLKLLHKLNYRLQPRVYGYRYLRKFIYLHSFEIMEMKDRSLMFAPHREIFTKPEKVFNRLIMKKGFDPFYTLTLRSMPFEVALVFSDLEYLEIMDSEFEEFYY